MAIEFKRMILKISDIASEVATIPLSEDHTDGSWLTTDIYEGELFLNVVDNILQTRTESGIITLIGGSGGGVTSVNGETGIVVLDKTDIGLGDVDNTSDADKPVSTAQQTEIDTKQDTLVSGTNIKTVNGNSLLGSENIVISGGATDFVGLTDTPSAYTGAGEYFVKVKEDLSGLEFVEAQDETLISTITVGVSRDLIITDKNKNLENDADITFTLQDNATVPFPVGTQIFFTKKFESLTIAAGTGVTINSVDNLLELGRINCGASLLQISVDNWNLIGELK